jgi:mRNA interferase MazF
MKRGDVVTVAISGDFGKPRAALIVQSDALSAEHTSVIVCPLTSELSDLHAFRVTLVPSDENGLRSRSQVMIDKPIAVRRVRVGRTIGRLEPTDLHRVNAALSLIVGLMDSCLPVQPARLPIDPPRT